jgi:hypothetical protein
MEAVGTTKWEAEVDRGCSSGWVGFFKPRYMLIMHLTYMFCRQIEVMGSTQVKLTGKLIKLGMLLMENLLELIATAEELIATAEELIATAEELIAGALGELLREIPMELITTAVELIALAEVATETGGRGKGWVRGLESMYILVMCLTYMFCRQIEVKRSIRGKLTLKLTKPIACAEEASEAGGCGGGRARGPAGPGDLAFMKNSRRGAMLNSLQDIVVVIPNLMYWIPILWIPCYNSLHCVIVFTCFMLHCLDPATVPIRW